MPRAAARHADRIANTASASAPAANGANDELFLEPMMGTPLAIFIEKEVADRDQLVEIIIKHGGTVSPGYSGVPYILVNPHSEAGQSLYRQYAGKKGKIVLNSRWVHECVRANTLQTFHQKWAGCKVTGQEQITPRPVVNANNIANEHPTTVHSQPHVQHIVHVQQPIPPPPQAQSQQHQHQHHPQQPQPPHQLQHQAPPPQAPQLQAQQHPPPHVPAYSHQSMQPAQTQMLTPGTPLAPPGYGYPVYTSQSAQHHASRSSMVPTNAPPQQWGQTPTPITPHQRSTHIQMMPPHPQNPYSREEHWNTQPNPAFAQMPEPHMAPMAQAHSVEYYGEQYRDDQPAWPDSGPDYYNPPETYESSYPQHPEYVPLAGPSSTTLEQTQTQPPVPAPQPIPTPTAPAPAPEQLPPHVPSPPPLPSSPREDNRGRKRTRAPPQPAAPASSLVLNRRQIPARSPTPPSRVIKSTYGGNLFTADDIEYLKKYIDYCQDQGLVLSLREICERIAIKAPHHTFYSWRRYCNKHQIRLGGYQMDVESRSPSPRQQEDEPNQVANVEDGLNSVPLTGDGPFTIDAAQRLYQAQGMRNRSPTPPRALFRSTTGKGVAFTSEDVAFLCKFMAFRKAQGRLDMVTFWKDVATKAPHHSRASWMKYYRRHKHELNRTEGDEPPPAPPSKKMRYDRKDDNLLAQYFQHKPEGTSDKIFQEFAKIYPHHPWKGWQEHHRIHKAKVDHLITRLNNGETLDASNEGGE